MFDTPVPDTNPLVERVRPTIHYWLDPEAHVYAFAVAANVLLAFFPLLIVIVSLFRYVLRWTAAVDAIRFALFDYFPDEVGSFLWRNLVASVEMRGPLQIVSVILLLFASNGVFLPLEIALNRLWGVRENRSLIKNQAVSFLLIFACGTLALTSIVLTGLNQSYLRGVTGRNDFLTGVMGALFFKAAAVPLSIISLLLIYWLLPNRKSSLLENLPGAILAGLALEGLKFLTVLIWPWLRLKLRAEYGPFINSVTILLFSFMAALVVLAGAEWTARRASSTGVAAEAETR